jgi:chlorobactene glucosyltransferase
MAVRQLAGAAWRARLRMARGLALALGTAGGSVAALVHYRELPRLAPSACGGDPAAGWPAVSIVVPARDEAATLPVLLRSLLALEYPDYEVLVVDDASGDGTAVCVEEFSAASGGRVSLLRSPGPPAGWTGKNYACHLGAAQARGEWLLFTDADTEHAPASLRLALAAARTSGARALSLLTGQRCVSFWERLLLPFAYQQYFAGTRPAALANGQYFLIARAAYAACGGHVAVASSLVDDVALAAALRRTGATPAVYRGERLVRVRMYTGLGPLAQGFTKNAFLFLRQRRVAGLAVAASTACNASLLPVLVVAAVRRERGALAVGVLAALAQMVGLAPWLRWFGVPLRYASLAPLAALGFSGIALASSWHALTGQPVRWKGRRYPVLAMAAAPDTAGGAHAAHG